MEALPAKSARERVRVCAAKGNSSGPERGTVADESVNIERDSTGPAGPTPALGRGGADAQGDGAAAARLSAPGDTPSAHDAVHESMQGSLDLAGRLALDGVLGRLLGQRRGLRLGRYEIAGAVGHGACGEVYRAYDAQLDRDVAIKVLLPARTHRDDGSERERLQDEARSLARLRHPNVVEVFDVGVGVVAHHADGSGQHGVYVVMQWLPGQTLAEWTLGERILDTGSAERPDWRAIVAAWRQVALGLQAAHDAGLVHADVKPHNAIIDADGRVRVVDFGLAQDAMVPRAAWSTLDGSETVPISTMLAGTPLYMAPEQHLGQLSPAADQFALSVSMWQTLAGVAPFAGDSVADLGMAKQTRRPERPRVTDVPAAIWAALEQGLALDPKRRHRDVAAWIDAVDRAARPGWPRRILSLLMGSGAMGNGAAL